MTISAQLEKPIIPLLSEQAPWPPSGNMGTIFNDNFYINFFQSPDKTTESSGYWSLSIFQELLWELMCLKDLVRNTAFARPGEDPDVGIGHYNVANNSPGLSDS